MNSQDRELLQALNLRHERLETAVALLKTDLKLFAGRLGSTVMIAPPPLPDLPEPIVETAPMLPPPIPAAFAIPTPIPPVPVLAETPEEPTPVEPEGPGLEIQFGRWLARIGVVFALLTLIFFSVVAYKDYYQYIGPWTKLSVLGFVSAALIAGGMFLERSVLVYGRTLAAGGMACLYYTLYGATYVRELQVIPSPFFGGLLLLAWSAAVLTLAERRKSELLSVFAISLAYFSSAITPVGGFTMVADLLLALTAVIFLIRNAWTGLSYLCLIGTYLGFVRQLFAGEPGSLLGFDLVPNLTFWPSATYLTGAWLIFTTGIFLAKTESFADGKRMAFLCLNNGAWVGLLTVAALLSGYNHLGGMLCGTGGALVASYFLARQLRADANDIAQAYLMQGLALATGGVVIAYSGVTRGLLITTESVFLAAAGAYSRNWILRAGGGLSALLGAMFLGGEIVFGNHYPWVLTFGGALAMLANATFARFDFWREPREVANARFILSSAFYILLALGLIVTGIVCTATDAWISPDLAITALVLAALVYAVPLFELPLMSQGLLVLAQVSSFGSSLLWNSGNSHGEIFFRTDPQWSQNIVALVTMLFVTWWPRQKLVRTTGWLTPLTVLYALAMVAFAYNAVHPHVSEQTWMMSAALLSLVFLVYGAWSRSWAFMSSGQIFLVLSVITFLVPENAASFPWTWWAAAVPIVVVFATGWIAREVLPRYLDQSEPARDTLRLIARIYQSIALSLLVRWVFGVVPSPEITLTLFALGTAWMLGGLRGSSSYFVRTGFVLDLAAIGQYVLGPGLDPHPFTWMDAGAFTLFLAQPALLRHWGRELISNEESWLVILASSLMAWLFVSNSIIASGSHNLTLGWALFAPALIVIGFASNERRQRWCGLAILGAAFVRVAVHDFWLFSDSYKVLTFFVLTVICLGLSFLYYKFADRLKEWL